MDSCCTARPRSSWGALPVAGRPRAARPAVPARLLTGRGTRARLLAADPQRTALRPGSVSRSERGRRRPGALPSRPSRRGTKGSGGFGGTGRWIAGWPRRSGVCWGARCVPFWGSAPVRGTSDRALMVIDGQRTGAIGRGGGRGGQRTAQPRTSSSGGGLEGAGGVPRLSRAVKAASLARPRLAD